MAYTNVFPRIREDSNGSTTLTVKVKRNPDKSEYFERDEYDIGISKDDVEMCLKMWLVLGFTDQRALEKYRQFWYLDGNETEIVIDSVPFGDYVEIEGSKADIESLIPKLGLQDSRRVTDAYFVEYANYCKENNIEEKENLVFGKK